MQHPDESKIHEWLDGALSPQEGSAVENHVIECAVCQPRVAEARGLIAGASRILNSLDNVPHVAVPPARHKRAWDTRILQAAAMLALIAGGGALIARARPNDTLVRAATSGPYTIEETVVPLNESAPVSAPQPPVKSPVPPRDVKRIAGGVARGSAADAVPAAAPAAVEAQMANSRDANFAAATEAATASAEVPASSPLALLRTEQSGLETRTYYEVAPTRVVTLVESVTAERTAAAGATQVARGRIRSGIAKGVIGGATSSAATVAPVQSDTIKWIDDASGKTMLLFGPFSTEELSALRHRIQAMRANR